MISNHDAAPASAVASALSGLALVAERRHHRGVDDELTDDLNKGVKWAIGLRSQIATGSTWYWSFRIPHLG